MTKVFMILVVVSATVFSAACGILVETGRGGGITLTIPGPGLTITAKGLEDAKDQIMDHLATIEANPFTPPEDKAVWHGHLSTILASKDKLLNNPTAGEPESGASKPAPAPL